MLDELIKLHGEENVKIKTARKASKIIPRQRLKQWYDMNKDEMEYIGELINQWLKQLLQIPDDMTKMESIQEVTFDDIPIELKLLIPSSIKQDEEMNLCDCYQQVLEYDMEGNLIERY